MMSKDKRKFYEFFAGTGMARLGLEPKWECVWSNDNDPSKVKIYRHNFGDNHLDTRDVTDIATEAEYQNFASSMAVPADMAWASFPCQDLSLAGWQNGMSAERSGTYWPFWKIMYSQKLVNKMPPVIVIENVTGLLYGPSFTGLCESLAALGMNFGAIVIDAKHFVPQSRPRVFIVAVAETVNLTSERLSEPPSKSPWIKNAVVSAYERLPKEIKNHWVWWSLPNPPKLSMSIGEIFIREPTDVKYNSTDQTQRLLSLMTEKNLKKIRQAQGTGKLEIGFLYKRTRNGQQRAEVRFDGIAGCLRTPKGGSSRQTIIVVEGKSVRTRLLSSIEAARLMGIPLTDNGVLRENRTFFPENFSYNESYSAMGDGVAVPVVKFLDENLLSALSVKASKAIPKTNKNKLEPRYKRLLKERVAGHIAAWGAQKEMS